MALGLIFCM